MIAEAPESDDEEEEDANGIAEVPVDSDEPRPKRAARKPVLHGIQLGCKHYFCGVGD